MGGAIGSTSGPGLPVLSNPYQSSVMKNSAAGNRNKSLPPGAGMSGSGPSGYIPTYKYSGIGNGIGGGAGMGGDNSYGGGE